MASAALASIPVSRRLLRFLPGLFNFSYHIPCVFSLLETSGFSPVRLSAPSPRSSAVSALKPRGGRPVPRHSGLLLGSVLFLIWAVLLCRLLLSVLPFVFRFLVPFLDLGKLGVSWASPLPGR